MSDTKTERVEEADRLTASDRAILRAVREVRYGSVEVTIHDANVVQVERREKVRFTRPEREHHG